MATLDEILAFDESNDGYIYENPQFIIDEDLRTIAFDDRGSVLGVVGDKNINRVNFQMPRMYNGFDMSEFQIRVNYVNAANLPNYYNVDDMEIDGDLIRFSWLVDSDAVAYIGEVKFVCVLFKLNGAVITKAFNTTIASATVLEGISVDGYVDPDVQTDIVTRLVEEIKSKIPPDYDELVNKVDDFMENVVTEKSEATPMTRLAYQYEGRTIELATTDDLADYQKIRIDYLGGNTFKHGSTTLNFADLYNYHMTGNSFAFVVYGDRAYLCSYINVDDAMREMRFESVINSDNRTKVSTIYVISVDGTAIYNTTVSDINSENSSNRVTTITDANRNSPNHYPSMKAMSDADNEIKEDLSNLANDIIVYTAFDSDEDEYVHGVRLANNGTEVALSGYNATKMIPLTGSYIELSKLIPIDFYAQIITYQEDMVTISKVNTTTQLTNNRLVLGMLDKYARVVFTDGKFTLKMEKGKKYSAKNIDSSIDLHFIVNTGNSAEYIAFNSAFDDYLHDTRLAGDGTTRPLSGYNTTDFIPCRSRFVRMSSSLPSDYYVQIICYDENKNIRKALNASDVVDNTVPIDFNTAYIRCVFATGAYTVTLEKIETTSVYNVPAIDSRKTIYVGPDREIKRLTDGIKKAVLMGNTDVYIDPYMYDLTVELSNYEKESTDGIKIGNGVRLYFSCGAKVAFIYNGNNVNINSRFSPFSAMDSDFAIYNLNFEAKNVRYCVHDECGGKGSYTHEYHDCIMHLDNSNNPSWNSKQCIGGGMGEHGTIIVDGGRYSSSNLAESSEPYEITFHNPQSGTGNTFRNKVVVKSVYFVDGGCYVSQLGDSPNTSTFFVDGCSMKKPPIINGNDPSGTGKWVMYAWNNEIRN